MNILKSAKHALIKDVCSSDLGKYSIRLFTATIYTDRQKQIETIDGVPELELAFSNLNVNFRQLSCSQCKDHCTERSVCTIELRAESHTLYAEINLNLLDVIKEIQVRFSLQLWGAFDLSEICEDIGYSYLKLPQWQLLGSYGVDLGFSKLYCLIAIHMI